MKHIVLAVSASLALAGCAVTSMDAKIAPQPNFQSSSIGAGKVVSVSVVDERPSKNLGKRSTAGGNIYMKEDLAAIYQAAIIDGLARQGFNTSGASARDAATLRVEIRGLEQVSTTGLWTMGSNISAAVKVYAKNGSEAYEQLYRADAENRTLAVSGAKSLNEKMNAVVDQQLEQMMSDRLLIGTLAGTVRTTGQ